jgi:hypothetical protein
MPKPVDDLVETLLEDPKFYPEKDKDDRKSTAWAIAYSHTIREKNVRKNLLI